MKVRTRVWDALDGVRMRIRDRRPDSAVANTAETSLQGFDVVLYFGGSSDSLYQLSGWLEVLKRIGGIRLVIVLREMNAVGPLAEKTDLPIVYVRSFHGLSRLVDAAEIKLSIYVNHSANNYQMLRFAEMLHVHIGHGESNKEYMASNQIKGFDYVLVAGQAAIDRLDSRLFRFDKERAIIVGRPHIHNIESTGGTTPTVLYAPTYEGDIAGANYSSLPWLGLKGLRQLIACGRYQVIYRPHPLTGRNDRHMRDIDRLVTEFVETSGTPHIVDRTSSLHSLMARTDLLVSDISSVPVDFLVYDRPYITALADDAPEQSDELVLGGSVVTPSTTTPLDELARLSLESDPKSAARARLAEYHLAVGSIPDAEMKFDQTLLALIRTRDEWIETRSTGGNRPGSGLS